MYKVIIIDEETGNEVSVRENVVAYDTWEKSEVGIVIDKYVAEHDNLDVEVNEENIKKVCELVSEKCFAEDEHPNEEVFEEIVYEAIEELNI